MDLCEMKESSPLTEMWVNDVQHVKCGGHAGKLDGRCDKCFATVQTSSGICQRMIEKAQPSVE